MSDSIAKFTCEPCGFKCVYGSAFRAHCVTKKHLKLTTPSNTPSNTPPPSPPSIVSNDGRVCDATPPKSEENKVEDIREWRCNPCNFQTFVESENILHRSSIEHKLAVSAVFVDPSRFICEPCRFSTKWNSHWVKHLATAKHARKGGRTRLIRESIDHKSSNECSYEIFDAPLPSNVVQS